MKYPKVFHGDYYIRNGIIYICTAGYMPKHKDEIMADKKLNKAKYFISLRSVKVIDTESSFHINNTELIDLGFERYYP